MNRVLTARELMGIWQSKPVIVKTTHSGNPRCTSKGLITNFTCVQKDNHWELSWSDEDGDPTMCVATLDQPLLDLEEKGGGDYHYSVFIREAKK